MLRPRRRLVFFRVSEDEFQQFTDMCRTTGARSISELARSAVQLMIQNPSDGHLDRVSHKLMVLESMLSDLNSKVHQLTAALGNRALKTAESKSVVDKRHEEGNRQGGTP